MVRIGSARTSVGPDSVGSRLEDEGIAFGGKTLTVGGILLSDMRLSFRTSIVSSLPNDQRTRHRDRIDSMNIKIHPSPLVITSQITVICRVMFPIFNGHCRVALSFYLPPTFRAPIVVYRKGDNLADSN